VSHIHSRQSELKAGLIMLWTSFLSRLLNLSQPRARCVAKLLILLIIRNARLPLLLDGVVYA